MDLTLRTELHQLLASRLSEDELRQLAFQLGVDYDDLPPGGKSSKTRELLLYLERRQEIDALRPAVKLLRPDIAWPGEAEPDVVAEEPLDVLQLSSADFDALVRILADLPEFRAQTTRIDFLDDAFAGSPRQDDILSLLDTSGTPRSASVRVITRLIQFGQETPGRESLALLIDRLLTYIGGGEHAVFLNNLYDRYPLHGASVPGDTIRRPPPPPTGVLSRQPFEPELLQLPGKSGVLTIGLRAVLTQEYAAFLRANPDRPRLSHKAGWSGQNPLAERVGTPVVGVTYEDAAAYCRWLSAAAERDYRLPTETEWLAALASGKLELQPGLSEWTATADGDDALAASLGQTPERMILYKLAAAGAEPPKRFAYLARLTSLTFTFRVVLVMR